jgi:protein involved in polysaccharide export with SLBB domain
MASRFVEGVMLRPSEHGDAIRRSRFVTSSLSLLFALFFVGCAAGASNNRELKSPRATAPLSPEQCEANAAIQAAADKDDSYRIEPGDELDISFYLNPEFNDSVTVRPDGKITLRLIGEVQAAGLTPGRLAAQIDKDYSSELRDPGAAVRVKNMPYRQVYVEGEVTKAGAVGLAPGMTALQAIAGAGGLTPDANSKALLIRRDACGVAQGSEIDLDTATNSPAQGEDVALMPQDILVVPRSGIAKLNLVMDQYVRKMLPINPYMSVPMPVP